MSELNLNAMRTVAHIARTGSLSRAAATLGLAQSAASRHLAQVEASLGGALFHRTGRGVSPTALGQQTLPGLQGLLAQADALAVSAREQVGVPGGVVTLGLVPSLAGPLASALHAQLHDLHPQIHLRVRDGYSGDMETALTDGAVDLAVVNRYRSHGPNRYRSLCETRLCVVARPTVLRRLLTAAGQAGGSLPRSAHLSLLDGTPLVMPVRPNALYSVLDAVAAKAGMQLNVVLEAGSSTIVKRMLADHDFATVLPQHAVVDELADGRLAAVPLAERSLRQHIVLATSPQRPFTLAAKVVAGLIPALVLRLTQGSGQAVAAAGPDPIAAGGAAQHPRPVKSVRG
jgi:LysR family transcriptional regulator, nitrogen assimilation regulatory protein